MIQLDAFDRAILAIVQDDASLSFAALGERVNLSASAALRRVQRLRADGIITASRAIVDPEKLGHPLRMIVEVTHENEHVAAIDDTRRALIEDPQVLQCYAVTGEADLFLILALPGMGAYKAFTDRHFAGNPNIKRFKTSVALETLKTTAICPIG